MIESLSEKLVQEKKELEERVAKLTKLLNIYMSNEKRYLELACQKADAQRQIGFIRHLQETASQKNTEKQLPIAEGSNTEQEKKPKQKFLYTNL